MGSFKKVAAWTGAIVFLVVAAAVTNFFLKYPDVGPPPSLTVERTPERIARGKYLAHNVSNCIDCHSVRDFSRFAGPIVDGSEGKGGEVFDENFGVPGTLYARNITPAGIGSWTDGELFRTLTSGVNREGKALFPLMPYPRFNTMTDEDLYSIIAYIRTLPAAPNEVPERSLNFPLNLIVRTIPARHVPQLSPDRNNPVAYGKYLVNAASCAECHTPREKGEPIKGLDFAGGSEFRFPSATIRSANITPDVETGIGTWTKEMFILRFKEYDGPEAMKIDTASMKRQTIMPWTKFAGMTEEDLGAVYEYLRTLIPVPHRVEVYTPTK
jgi:mono/diheme cytochrome c family protein